MNSALARKIFYTRIYRQQFSPDGNWLVAVDSHSRMCIFELSQALEPSASHNERRFKHLLEVENPIYGMATVQSRLVCGDASGQLYVYRWEDIVNFDSTDQLIPLCNFNGFPSNLPFTPPNEINAVACIHGSYTLYAGAGDNAVRVIDIERPDKVISSFVGHSEYVNELAVQSENAFLSASEDGTVCLWDLRSKDNFIFNIASEEKLRRSNCGRGVCALDVEEDFMVCGGDVELGIWHIGSRSLASVLMCERPPFLRHIVVKMNGDRILSGGSCPYLMQFDYTGRHLTSVKTSSLSIYSIETNMYGANAMTAVAGDSALIDAFLNLGYVAFNFSTFPVHSVHS